MKNLVMMLVLLGMVFTVSSCNMIRGAGQDIGNVGDAVRDVTN